VEEAAVTAARSVMLAGLPGEQTMAYQTVWECGEPPAGKTYVVVRQRWSGNYSQRHILEIVITGDREGPS
jgi:hypothetical protein